MNKIAQYLNAHMLGEVVVSQNVRKSYANDGSVLQYVPDMVAYPRATSDIRKIARFSWQLAEKGHRLPLVMRGAGTDTTGAAIGQGMIIATNIHMNKIFEYDNSQKLIRLQPGVTVSTLSNALSLYGAAIPELRWDHQSATVGGAVASRRSSIAYVDQLEIVLASGDILQTKRISKRDLDKKKGLQTFEGEVYRAVDGLIEDNSKLLDELVYDDARYDHEGYAGIELVKQKNGSFDLTPLFVGSQGTLGVISEMILKPEFVNQKPAILIAAFADSATAFDALDIIDGADPTAVEYIDGKYFEAASKMGKTYKFHKEATDQLSDVTAVVVVTINDFAERVRKKKLKKLTEKLTKLGCYVTHHEDADSSDLRAVSDVTSWLLNPQKSDTATVPMLDGVFIPTNRFDAFSKDLETVAKKSRIELPLYGRPLDELWYIRPTLRMSTATDKQKLFKLTAEVAELVNKHNGSTFGAGSEGRIGASLASADDPHQQLFKKLKDIFDPHGTLNPGVKQGSSIRDLAKQVRSSYEGPAATGHLGMY